MIAHVAAPAPHVALVFSSLHGAGIQRVMLTLAEGFIARGLRVDLVVVNAAGDLRQDVPAQARIVDLHARGALHGLPALVRYFRRERPQAVLSSQTHHNVVAIAARWLAGVPMRLAVSVHVALDAVLRESPGWKERTFPLLARLLYRRADAIVAVSQGTAEGFSRATGVPLAAVTVIHNPIVTPTLFTRAALPVDHPWCADTEPPLLLSAGRLTRQKDHATLIRAFALVRAARPARLIILGEGEDRPALEHLVHALGLDDDVQLPGFTINPLAYMAKARLFVLSSRWEGFGNVIVEAMACGTPVVSTDCPSGPAEILDGGAVGRLTPVGDPKALAEAIRLELDHPTPPQRLRERAMAFTADAAVDRYLRVLLP